MPACVCVCVYRYRLASVKYSALCLTLCTSFSRVSRSLAADAPSVPAIPNAADLALFALRVFLIQILCVVCVVLSHCASATTDEPRKLANPSTPFAASAPSFTLVAARLREREEVECGGVGRGRHLVNKRI